MCRSTDYLSFQPNFRGRLKIRAFFVQFSVSISQHRLPESLTLLYLPRINGSALEIDGAKIRPNSPAYVTLHRVVSSPRTKDVRFESRERVWASEGVRFEVYLREEKVVKGIFRKSEDGEWELECKCALESEAVGVEVSEAEVCVDAEGEAPMGQRVAMVVKKKKKNRRVFDGLEEIPEEREMDDQSSSCCSCGCEESTSGGEGSEMTSCRDDDEEEEMEMEMEGVRWAIDVGIWVVCLGVGLLVSKASAKSVRLRRKLAK